MRQITPERQQILGVLADGCGHSVAQVATVTGKTPSNTNKLLGRLLRQGLVEQPSWGIYALPGMQSSNPTAPHIRAGDSGVYVLRNGPYYKIGKSHNVEWRVRQLSVALPQETLHVHTIHTDHPDELERELHERYALKRIRGEWFELDMFDVDELCQMGPEPI